MDYQGLRSVRYLVFACFVFCVQSNYLIANDNESYLTSIVNITLLNSLYLNPQQSATKIKETEPDATYFESDTSFSVEEKVVLDSVLGELADNITDFDRNEIYKSLKTTLKETPLIPLNSSDDGTLARSVDMSNIDKIEENLIGKELDALLSEDNQSHEGKTNDVAKQTKQTKQMPNEDEGGGAKLLHPGEASIFDLKRKKATAISQVTTTVNPLAKKIGTASTSAIVANSKKIESIPAKINGKWTTKKNESSTNDNVDEDNVATAPSWKKDKPWKQAITNNGTKEYKSINFIKEFYKTNVDKKYIVEMLNSLTSSYFQGRATRTRGQRISLAFLNYELEKAGYAGPYNGSLVQALKLSDVKVKYSTLKCGDKDFKYISDYHFDIAESVPDLSTYNLIFIGKGKQKEIENAFEKNYEQGSKNAVLVTPSNLFDIKSLYKHLLSLNNPVDLVVVLNNQQYEMERVNVEYESKVGKNFSRRLTIDNSSYNKKFISTIFVTQKFWNNIYGKETPYKILKEYLYNEKRSSLNVVNIKSQKLMFKASIYKDNTVVGNIVALCHAYDMNKENVIISANYDGKVNSASANYNATGVATMLTLAKVFGKVYKKVNLNKNLVFVFFVGNNQGNLGSKFYTTFPSFAHVNTFMNIGMNGLGTLKTKDPKVLYASCSRHYLIKFDDYIKKTNTKSGNYKLDFSINKNLNYLYSSDAWQFGQINIPFIEFTDSPKPEEFQQIRDASSSINFNVLMPRMEYIASFIWNVITSPETSRDLIEKKALIEAINLRK